MKLVMLGHDEGGEFHRTACLEDVKEFLYMLEMVAVPLEHLKALVMQGDDYSHADSEACEMSDRLEDIIEAAQSPTNNED